jgi:hypothetical protein
MKPTFNMISINMLQLIFFSATTGETRGQGYFSLLFRTKNSAARTPA